MVITKEWLSGINKIYRESMLPKRFLTFDTTDLKVLGEDKKTKKINSKSMEKVKNYIKNIDSNFENGRGLLLSGPIGVGKTMMATVIGKEAIGSCRRFNKPIKELYNAVDIEKKGIELNKVFFIQATELSFLAVKSTCTKERLNMSWNIRDTAFLIIDDITKMSEYKSGVERNYLDDILRYRNNHMLPTIITSQLPLEQLKDILGLPMCDLIRDTCEEVLFVANSQRGLKYDEEEN